MTRITIPNTISDQVRAATGPVEFVDENGITVVTVVLPKDDGCPHSDEELEKIRQESGRPLADIWRSLGAK
jgi:hypothetical protein